VSTITADKLSNLEQAPLDRQTWLTALEAAAHLKVKPRTLLLWVRQGKVKAFALSGTKRRVWRFRQIWMLPSWNRPCYHPSCQLCSLTGG